MVYSLHHWFGLFFFTLVYSFLYWSILIPVVYSLHHWFILFHTVGLFFFLLIYSLPQWFILFTNHHRFILFHWFFYRKILVNPFAAGLFSFPLISQMLLEIFHSLYFQIFFRYFGTLALQLKYTVNKSMVGLLVTEAWSNSTTS